MIDLQASRFGLMFALMSLSACSSSPLRLSTGTEIPAAEGTVKTETTDNQNTRLDITVKHLAPPERIAPEATTYVVWAEPTAGGMPSNLGALKINKDLEGNISTITPLKNFRLFVTAESSGFAPSPSGQRLLWTNVNTS